MPDWISEISPRPRLAGDMQVAGNWIEPLRVIYDHELVLFRGGQFIVEIGNQSFVCDDNTFIIIPPVRQHVSRAVSPEGGHRYWVHFDWTYMGPHEGTPTITYLPGKPLTDRYRPAADFVPSEILHGHIQSPRRVFDLYDSLLSMINCSDNRKRHLSRARLLELLVELLVESPGDNVTAESAKSVSAQVRAALDRIAHTPISDMVSIQNTLEQIGYSYAHLCRCFRDTYGIPPLQYVNSLRVERAKLLIRDTSATIIEIAGRVGCGNPAYFCRLFRKHTGMSPTQYASSCRPEPS